MSDIVYIRGLRADAVIGVYEWEHHVRQTLVIDLEMRFSTRPAAASDALADALDYHAVASHPVVQERLQKLQVPAGQKPQAPDYSGLSHDEELVVRMGYELAIINVTRFVD